MKPTHDKSPPKLPSDNLVPLEAVLCTEELNRRPSRPPDSETENRALVELALALADSPPTILQTLAEKILEVLYAGSAGISLLTGDEERFHWPAIAGQWQPHIGGGTPRNFGPCGDVLDRNGPLLFRHIERRYTYFLPVTPMVEEALLVPFYVKGKAVGTIWAVSHDDRRTFDAEDLRRLESLGRFASAAYQVVVSLDAVEGRSEALRQRHTKLVQQVQSAQDSRRAALNLMEDAVQSRQAVETLNVALRESEERYRSLVSVITDVSWVTDATGAFIASQPEWQAYTGQTWEEHGGFGWVNALHPEDRDRVKAIWLRACETHAVYESRGRVWHARSQQWRYYVARATPLFRADGSVREWVGTCTDIHELKQTEEELLRLNDELEARVEDRTRELVLSQERLRSLAAELSLTEQRERQRVAADLHDYLAQLLALSMIKLGQTRKQAVAPLVAQALTDVQQVLEQALTYTRTMVAQLSPPIQDEFGLPMALRWLLEQMKQRDFIVSLELKSEIIPLPEDQARLLYQSVRELLINVAKHGQTDHATVTVTVAEGVLRIAVTDQGAGFDLAAAAGKTSRIPSFGLFSIRERMISLGGRFELVSRPGEGTTATLVSPLGGSAAGDVSSVESSARHSSFVSRISQGNDASRDTLHDHQHSALQEDATIRVLLADDHAMVRQGLKGILDGYPDIAVVGEASDGQEAVELARVLSPDVVVMDVNMPKMDGIEAIRRIKVQQPATLIVGLSLSKSSQMEPLLLEAGASSYVSKDAASDRLYEAIIAAVRREIIRSDTRG